MQQHYKGSTSTSPRVARLCQIREASPRCTEKITNPKKIYASSHGLIVRPVQSTIPVSSDSQSHPSTLYHLPGELVSISSVLLSALACTWNDSPISFRIACGKISSADSAPRASNSDFSTVEGNSPLSSTFTSSGGIDQRNTVRKMCFSSSTGSPTPVSIRISRVSRSCSSHSVSMQVSSGRDFSSRVPFKYLDTILGTCQFCKCW